MPTALISLTAPKPLVKHFKGRHFVGGRYVSYEATRAKTSFTNLYRRFVSPAIAKKYSFDVPEYEGIDQIVEMGTDGQKL